MSYRKEVEEKIGVKNVRLLYNEARQGRITPEQLKNIGILMHGDVNGVYEANKGKGYVYVLQDMLDCWYNNVLCNDKVDGVELLKEILEDHLVGLHPLARQLETQDNKQATDNLGHEEGGTSITQPSSNSGGGQPASNIVTSAHSFMQANNASFSGCTFQLSK